jgi:hypothetical protein
MKRAGKARSASLTAAGINDYVAAPLELHPVTHDVNVITIAGTRVHRVPAIAGYDLSTEF